LKFGTGAEATMDTFAEVESTTTSSESEKQKFRPIQNFEKPCWNFFINSISCFHNRRAWVANVSV